MFMLSARAGRRGQLQDKRDPEILAAALDVLADVGYDRLTMDAVAAKARAGKATLYRRWSSKAELVVEAIDWLERDNPACDVDTGTLRGDLLGQCYGKPGMLADQRIDVLAGMATALRRDPQLARTFQEQFVQPRQDRLIAIFRRAQDRGEIAADADIQMLASVIPGMVYFQAVMAGDVVDRSYVERVVDRVVMPAATGRWSSG